MKEDWMFYYVLSMKDCVHLKVIFIKNFKKEVTFDVGRTETILIV